MEIVPFTYEEWRSGEKKPKKFLKNQRVFYFFTKKIKILLDIFSKLLYYIFVKITN